MTLQEVNVEPKYRLKLKRRQNLILSMYVYVDVTHVILKIIYTQHQWSE